MRSVLAVLCIVAASCLLSRMGLAAEAPGAIRSESEQQLKRLLDQGPIEGAFLEKVPGAYVFAPSRADLPQLPVVNPESIGALASGPTLSVRGVLQPGGELKVSSYLLSLTPKERVRFAGVRQATSTLRQALIDAIKPGSMSVTTKDFRGDSKVEKDTRQGIRAIVDKYIELVGNGSRSTEVQELVQEWIELRAQLLLAYTASQERKAIYGDPDNYAPWRYERIFRQAPSVAAIGLPGADKPVCSAVLIASDLILTAGHCFSDPKPTPPSEFEAWFGYFEGPSDHGPAPAAIQRIKIAALVAPRPERLAEILNGRFDATLLDYVVLRLSHPPTPIAGGGIEPQCLRRLPSYRGDAVYVMGFPEGRHMTVHDSSRVYLPYRVVDGPELFKLRLNVHADLSAQAMDADEIERLMGQFDASYKRKTVDNTTWRYLQHVLDGGQPRMGIVSDTFHGNSGGPVYERERAQCVVGVLLAGMPDTGRRRTANWSEHESVLPVDAVLEDMEKDVATRGVLSSLNLQ